MDSGSNIITVSLNPTIDRVIEVPGLKLGAHQVGREISRTAGGKAVNVSLALAAMGVGNIATGFLGEESRPVFQDVLKGPSIRDEFFALPGRTRENVTLTDPDARQETHIRDVGLAVPDAMLAKLKRKLELLCQKGTVVIFGGSLPPGMSGEDFLSLINASREAGARVAVDTSGKALDAIAGRSLWLLKPNAAELAHLAGRQLANEAEMFQAARELTSHVSNVLLSRGSKGACLFAGSCAACAHVELDPARVRNTVGCGDVLLAGFVAGLAGGKQPREALAGAVACASASACTLKAAHFEPETAEELRSRVEVTDF